ncbi:MAG: Rdx family protein [Phycisphaerales bacterium]|nr:MAG: Rdx family protein [Phycisphaerales bacterium]
MSLADAIKAKFGIEAECVEGGGGIFDVRLDGKLIYSRHQTGRFPEHREVLTAIAHVAPKTSP